MSFFQNLLSARVEMELERELPILFCPTTFGDIPREKQNERVGERVVLIGITTLNLQTDGMPLFCRKSIGSLRLKDR